MRKSGFISTIILLTVVFHSIGAAQTQTGEVKTFDKDGLSFKYPAEWELTDQSTAEMQQLKLSLAKSSALIYINSPREPITADEQLLTFQENITARFIENVTQKFTLSPAVVLLPETTCTTVNSKSYGGTVIRGTYLNQLSTADILPLFPEHRFINLVFIRNNKDFNQTNPGWEMLTETLKTVTPNAKDLPNPSDGIINGGKATINGKAVSLPRPPYPAMAQSKRLRGSVSVEVLIDETGKVIKVRSYKGAIEFANETIWAAKKARFTPSYLCGKPVKTSGIIIYDFVP